MPGPFAGPRRGIAKVSDRIGANVRPDMGFLVTYPSDDAATEKTFTAVVDGPHTFRIWGAGGAGGTGSGSTSGYSSGAYARITRDLKIGDVVKGVVGRSGSYGLSAGGSTKLTLPDGTLVTAEGGKSISGGVAPLATGGDLNINGTMTKRGSGQGCDAPGEPGAPGGPGGAYRSASSGGSNGNRVLGGTGGFPGASGGNGNNTSDTNSAGEGGGTGADGLILISYGRPI